MPVQLIKLSDLLLERFSLDGCLHGRFARSTSFLDEFSLYCSDLRPLGRPAILPKMIQLAPERNPVELIQYRLMKFFADTVCLRVSGLGLCAFYVINARV